IELGDGEKSVIGGIGDDTITVGTGADIVLGDSGQIVQDFNSSGAPVLTASGAHHRDIVLETVGTITSQIALDSAAGAALSNLSTLSSADMILLAGAYDTNGNRINSGTNGAWATSALLMSLTTDGNDTITAGDGDNVLIGQGSHTGGLGGNKIVAGDG